MNYWTKSLINVNKEDENTMPPSRIKTSDAVSKRKVNQSRDLWIDFFRDALNSLLSTDEGEVKEFTDLEAEAITSSATLIANKALEKTEQRFPGM